MTDSFLSTEVIDFSTAQEFVNAVHSATILSNDPVPRYIYRGVGDARHQLTPAALRTDESSRARFLILASITTPKPNLDFSLGQALAEIGILRVFYQVADRHGLVLPHVDPFTHRSLLESISDTPFSGSQLHELFNGWPPPELRPLLGLAQHYGLPTRMLDWSIDPLVGCYFAADRGVAHLERGGEARGGYDIPTHIAVWQTIPHLLTQISLGSSNLARLNVVHAPRGGNQNLAAQKGIFTVYAETKGLEGEKTDIRALNEIVQDLVEKPDPTYPRIIENYKSIIGDRQPFTLFRLPISASQTLLYILDRMGYDAARLFPGFAGIAMSVRNLARLRSMPRSPF